MVTNCRWIRHEANILSTFRVPPPMISRSNRLCYAKSELNPWFSGGIQHDMLVLLDKCLHSWLLFWLCCCNLWGFLHRNQPTNSRLLSSTRDICSLSNNGKWVKPWASKNHVTPRERSNKMILLKNVARWTENFSWVATRLTELFKGCKTRRQKGYNNKQITWTQAEAPILKIVVFEVQQHNQTKDKQNVLSKTMSKIAKQKSFLPNS